MLDDLSTYALSDLVPFEAPAYARLFEGHNAVFWPALVAGPLIALGALLAARRGHHRASAAALAALWVWLGAAFYAHSYARLNWAGEHLAWGCYAQALVTLVVARRGAGHGSARGAGVAAAFDRHARRLGWAIAVGAMLLFPLLDPLRGRPWAGVEVVGQAPEPTAWFTIGWVLAVGRWRALGLIWPLAVAALGALTAWLLSHPPGGG